MNRLLILLGALLLLTGFLWPWIRRIPLFHLPGDLIINRPGFKFYFPITTMVIVSLAVSMVAWLLRK